MKIGINLVGVSYNDGTIGRYRNYEDALEGFMANDIALSRRTPKSSKGFFAIGLLRITGSSNPIRAMHIATKNWLSVSGDHRTTLRRDRLTICQENSCKYKNN